MKRIKSLLVFFFFSSRRRHTTSVSAFLLNRSSDLAMLRNKETRHRMFSGRVQQTYKHSVPRFFVPEHGTMFTLALVRFPPTRSEERRVGKECRSGWSPCR